MKNKSFTVDRLQVKVFPNRDSMGAAAAFEAAQILRATIQKQGTARIIVASAPSQNELIAGLAASPGIDWAQATVFHMDEYVGLPAIHPASFHNYQQRHLLARVTPAVFHGIRGESSDPEAECARYSAVLAEAPIDLVCMGIGENGHIAFNDPPVADFADPLKVKVVKLDDICRQQQVNDGCFPNLDSVPASHNSYLPDLDVGPNPDLRRSRTAQSSGCGGNAEGEYFPNVSREYPSAPSVGHSFS